MSDEDIDINIQIYFEKCHQQLRVGEGERARSLTAPPLSSVSRSEAATRLCEL